MWLSALALAAMPPGIDLDDIDRWESQAERLLELPTGCWEWVGEAKWDWDVGRWGGSRGDAVFAGQTEDGVWGAVHLEPLGEVRREGREPETRVYDAKEARFAPLVGKFVGARVTVAGGAAKHRTEADLDQNAKAANILRSALDRLSGDAETSWVKWDDARNGIVLYRSISLAPRDSQFIEVQVFFPNGGTLPTTLDMTFPSTFRTGRLPRWTIRDAAVHIRGTVSGDQVFPTSEAYTFGFGIFGFRFHGAQTVRYRRVMRCLPAVMPTPATVDATPPRPPPVPTPGVLPPRPAPVVPTPVRDPAPPAPAPQLTPDQPADG